MTLRRLAVAFQSMCRRSSPGTHSRRDSNRRSHALVAARRLGHGRPQPDGDERRVDGGVPRERLRRAAPPQSERPRGVHDERPCSLASPPHRDDGNRLAHLAPRRNRDLARRLRAAEHLGANLAQAQTRRTALPVAPAVAHLTAAPDGESGRRFPSDGDAPLSQGAGVPRVEPHRGEQRHVSEQHRVERPWHPQAQHPTRCQGRAHPQRAPGAEDHAVGTSVLSRIALSAASAVTPSSSSSGATLTRWRSTADASAFTSSGIT